MDKIRNLGNSTIQHGRFSDRVYLMKLDIGDYPDIVFRLKNLALENRYSKIVAKVPDYAREAFREHGFEQEAAIPGEGDKEDVYFMAKYLAAKRRRQDDRGEIKKVLNASKEKMVEATSVDLPEGHSWSIMKPEDAEEMTEVYKIVFETYPFPIHDPDYIRETMETHVAYYGVRDETGKLIAIASSEMDEDGGSAEMTDFATLPEARGKNLAVFLLEKMEADMKERGIPLVYTIARAVSFGMNISFAKMGYVYGGTLINNTNISGGLESMNVWYKYH